METLPSVLFIYPGEARKVRLDAVKTGEAPKDFFYGLTHIQEQGFKVAIGNSRKDPSNVSGQAILYFEKVRNRFLNFGLASSRVMALADEIAAFDMALSFNDFFSLSMGLYRNKVKSDTLLMGGFHGLSDIPERVPPAIKGYATQKIIKALSGLDHLFFSGEVDRQVAIEKFNIPPEKTSYYPFGVDAGFWHPAKTSIQTGGILSIGSDINRDFNTLMQSNVDDPIRIITRLNIEAPTEKSNIEIVRGNLNQSPITDTSLRELYQNAELVVVPLQDVWQPTGCSVTLQAMACGKPVIVSDIKGLWDRDILKSGTNCLLVPPGNSNALGDAIHLLKRDEELRTRMGIEARKTVEKHFSISRMEQALETIIRTQAETLSLSKKVI
ncbi:MAG: glycosyltransferase family 4 protein [Magnetovibrio sp.]|nr:glycosyltransferase family 4 protein [Magnetovibrio sp.]